MLLTYTAILKTKKELASQVYLLQFSYPKDNNWTFQAGQYMIFHLPILENNHPIRRLYSIASPPSQKNTLDFVIELVSGGLGSEYIAYMKEEDIITIQGPAGIFTFKPSERDIIMLATGTGIAPIYSMIADRATCLPADEAGNVKREAPHMYLFWGLKYKKNIYLKEQLDVLVQKNPNFQYSICLSREERVDDVLCLKGHVTNGLEKLKTDGRRPLTNYDYYLCGNPHVIESLRENLKNNGVPKEQIYFEKFT